MSRLSNALAGDRPVVTCELNPPKGIRLEPMLEKAKGLADTVDAFNVTDSHAAKMSLCPLAAAHHLARIGAEPILQLTTRDRNRIALQADLLGAATLGVHNVVFMGGDPPKNGDHPDAKPVFDLFSSQVIAAGAALASGTDMMGNALDGTPELLVGAVVNPGADDLDVEIGRMQEKIEAGAKFFQTQAVFEPAGFERFARRVEGFGVPVLAGVIPLKSPGMARYMTENVPGIVVPDAMIATLEASADREETGKSIAAELAGALAPLCAGVHLMAIGWERHLPEIIARGGLR